MGPPDVPVAARAQLWSPTSQSRLTLHSHSEVVGSSLTGPDHCVDRNGLAEPARYLRNWRAVAFRGALTAAGSTVHRRLRQSFRVQSCVLSIDMLPPKSAEVRRLACQLPVKNGAGSELLKPTTLILQRLCRVARQECMQCPDP